MQRLILNWTEKKKKLPYVSTNSERGLHSFALTQIHVRQHKDNSFAFRNFDVVTAVQRQKWGYYIC